MTVYQSNLIEKHNREMEIIMKTAEMTNLSPCLLFYCAHFGIIGIPWQI